MGKSHTHFHKKVLIIFVQLTLDRIHGEICSTSGHVQGLSYPFVPYYRSLQNNSKYKTL